VPPGPVETRTQARILTLLRDEGAMSRVELAERTQMSRTTVAAEVAKLDQLGLTEASGQGRSRGGRPSATVELAADLGFVGVDIGSTSVDVAVTGPRLDVLEQISEECDIKAGPHEVLGLVETMVAKLRTQVPDRRLLGAGVGVPGPVDFDRGVPVSPPIMPGWDRFPVRDTLARAIGLPVVLDNDVNLMALGEMHAGVADRVDSFLFVKIGTGIGCGIVVHRELYRGVDGCAGDIGHIQAEDTGPVCACGNIACLEAFFGGAALARDGLAAAQSGRSPVLATMLEERGTVTAADVADAAAQGDAISTALFRAGGQRLGEVLASLVSFFNPGMLVIGGQVASVGHELLAEIRGAVYRRSLPLATGKLPVVHSELGGSAGVVGASRLASERVFAPDFAQ
jgi:glucokinase-like ROK family protein